MYIDKLIKKETFTLIISVGILLIVFIGISFASFFKVDEGKENVVETGDLAISFCSDSTCDNTYENIGQVIGTTKQNGTSVPSSIYPYPDDGSYSNATPYIFKVTNTGSMDLTVTVKLNEDADFLPSGNYSEYSRLTDLYANHLKIAIRKVVLAPNSKYQLGDVNMDGIVNLDDSVYILEALAGTKTLTDEQTKLADVNKDGTVDALDSTEVLRVINGADTALEKTYINLFSELSNNIVCDNEKIAPGETSIFFLWLYMDESTPNQAQKTYFIGNLDIKGEYIPDGYNLQKTDCTILAGTGKNIGDEVKCGTEEFYIYSNDGTNIKMLAKNVLMVGKNANKDAETYGLQSEETTNTTLYTVAFDSGTNSYEKSDIKVYVDNYKERLLRRYNLSRNIEATMITKDELVELGCAVNSSHESWYECSKSNYDWTYSTMYWTRTEPLHNGEPDTQYAFAVKNGSFGTGILTAGDGDWNFYKTINSAFGVRPVIIVPVRDIIK